MDRQLLTKNGYAIMKIAMELLNYSVGARILRVSDFSEKLKIGRGTVQNALQYIEKEGGIALESRGHLGTFVLKMDRKKLWHLSGLKTVLGTMPLPYSKRYEGLATALYEAFEKADTPFNLAFMRGGETRFAGLLEGRYDFSVSSRFSAEQAIRKYPELMIAIQLGNFTYVGGHTILLRDGIGSQLRDGMKVAVDPSSYDQKRLTDIAFKGYDVQFVEMPYNQLLTKLQHKEIDATVWNEDEVSERYQLLKRIPLALEDKEHLHNTEAVLVFHKDNTALINMIKDIVSVEHIRAVQQAVMNNERAPKY